MYFPQHKNNNHVKIEFTKLYNVVKPRTSTAKKHQKYEDAIMPNLLLQIHGCTQKIYTKQRLKGSLHPLHSIYLSHYLSHLTPLFQESKLSPPSYSNKQFTQPK